MRAVLPRPDAVPARRRGALATATAMTGPPHSPSPAPIANAANSTYHSGEAVSTSPSSSRPLPTSVMPAASTLRAPQPAATGPEWRDTSTNASAIGSSSSPTRSSAVPRTAWR